MRQLIEFSKSAGALTLSCIWLVFQWKGSPNHMKHLIRFIIAAGALTLLCIGLTFYWERSPEKWQQHNRECLYALREEWIGGLRDMNDPAADKRVALDQRLSKVYEKRLEQYKGNLAGQNANLWYQVVCIAIALIIVLKVDSNKFTIPGIGTEVPISWVYWAVPIYLAYLWMSFGFRLHELIDSRMALY